MDSSLDALIVNELSPLNLRQNNQLKYFSYYLPSDMQEKAYDDEMLIVAYDDIEILININIASIINRRYYETYSLTDDGFFDEKNCCYNNYAYYNDLSGQTKELKINIYQNDDLYFIHVFTSNMQFYSVATLNEVYEVVRHIYLMARCITVDEDAVVSVYSTKDVIDYQKKQIDLFEYIIPSSGTIADLAKNGIISNVYDYVEQEDISENTIEEENAEETNEQEDIENEEEE